MMIRWAMIKNIPLFVKGFLKKTGAFRGKIGPEYS
jgi:hypothetical protein